MSSSPGVQLILDVANGVYQPGEELAGNLQIDGAHLSDVRTAELSVMWYTVGQGDEDMAVHQFERLVDEPPAKPLSLRVPHAFSTALPLSPLSYEGRIVKVCWCVRARLFLSNGQTAVAETPFRLGDVPAPSSGESLATGSEGPSA